MTADELRAIRERNEFNKSYNAQTLPDSWADIDALLAEVERLQGGGPTLADVMNALPALAELEATRKTDPELRRRVDEHLQALHDALTDEPKDDLPGIVIPYEGD